MEVEYEGVKYQRNELLPTQVVVDIELIATIFPKFQDDGACVQNSYRTAKATGATCIEGFVICKEPPSGLTVIRHCWNKIGQEYFDVTKDFVWSKLGRNTVYSYFQVAEFSYSEYNPQKKEIFEIVFLSDAIEIAAGVKKEIFEELKQNQK